jgi:ankyrin repeat protein
MTRTKDELKSAYSRNRKVLDKLKKNMLKMLKSTDKIPLLSSGNIPAAVKLIKEHEELISDQLEVTNELIVLGEEVGDRKRRDLFEDVKNGDCAAIAISYIEGAGINRQDRDMWTPLHIAALNGHKTTAEFLIRMGAEVDSKTGMKQTPLHIAASHDRRGVAEILLQNGANAFLHNKDKQCPHTVAVSMEVKELIASYEHKFIESNMDEPSEFLQHCDTMLLCAVRYKNHKVLPLLVELHERGKSVGEQGMDERGNGALHIAVMNGDEKTLKALLSIRPFPFKKNKDDMYPIELAESNKIKKIMADYEQDYIGDVTSNPEMLLNMGGELFLYCIQKGYTKAVEELVGFAGQGLIDINMRDADKNTPLHFAAKLGHVEIAALLLKSGAEMLMFNKDQQMPADFVGDNKKMIRIFNNFERLWVNRIIRMYIS